MKWAREFFGLFWGLFLSCILFGLSCSINSPEMLKGESRPCYIARVCMVINQKNPDKSICVEPMRKCLVREDYVYCNEKDDPIKLKECLLLLR